ncbi:hypothetical protein OG693_30350 [Streptomyces sp. NBC_01259]
MIPATPTALASTREPVGSWMVNSMGPELPGSRFFAAGAAMRGVPSLWAT